MSRRRIGRCARNRTSTGTYTRTPRILVAVVSLGVAIGVMATTPSAIRAAPPVFARENPAAPGGGGVVTGTTTTAPPAPSETTTPATAEAPRHSTALGRTTATVEGQVPVPDPAAAAYAPATGSVATGTTSLQLSGPVPETAPTPISNSNRDAVNAPIFEKWWFWTAIAAVAVTTVVIVATSSGPSAPRTDLGTMTAF